MAKDLFVSSSPHETKVAVLEDDQLVEVYFERETNAGVVGGIYKGRVSRVLPGMQSAFVNIGLERDAFLYVSDFVEDEEEYDKIFSEAEARATRFVETGKVTPSEPTPAAPAPLPQPAAVEAAEAAAPSPDAPTLAPAAVEASEPAPPIAPPSARPPADKFEHRRHERDHFPRRGRSRRGGRDFRHTPRPESREPYTPPTTEQSFELLPGESLAKYRGVGTTTLRESPPPEAAPSESISAETPEIRSATPAETSLPAAAEEHVATSAIETVPPAENLSALAEVTPVVEHAEVAAAPALAISEVVSEADQTVLFAPVHVFRPVTPEPIQQAATAPESPETVEAPAPPERAESVPVAEHTEQAEAAAMPVQTVEGPETDLESAEDVAQENLELAAEDQMEEGEEEEEIAAAEAAAPGGQEAGDQATGAAETGAMAAPADGAPAEPGERKYTLREPHQRPRFAPRRRRGRRGMGRPRMERPEPSRPGNHQPVQISDLLKEGQEIIVQIAKEPLGTKGARITSHVALPGRYLVFMPTIDHIGVSRKIASEEERLRLRNIILENRGSLTGGFIVRTAGAGRSDEEFKADLKFLSTLWSEIRSKAERMKAPALLHRDLDLVQRILRDILSPDFKQVRVDNETEYERCVEFVNRCQPSLVGNVKLYTRTTPMFEEFGIQQEVDKALKPKVWLKSGGYIVINQTEALVAIDVNTGKFVGKTNRLEDTIVKTNIDAVNEIVRQIRLRDLGGIIVIDFIDMDERKNRMKVVQALEEALRRDRAPTKILSFNDFGLVALTRKRVKQSLERTVCQPCSYCTGSGWIKSVTTICYEIMGEVKKMAKQLEGDSITLRVNPDVAQALKSKQGALLSELEALTHKDIIVKGDVTVHQERFEIY